jgi:hypothetical protein
VRLSSLLPLVDGRAPSNVTEFVTDANGLDRFRVTHLFAPLGTDLLLGATFKRQLVVWQHNKQAAYRWGPHARPGQQRVSGQ